MKGKKRILFISPHLSTGGLPQYLSKKIESLNQVAEIFCVEYNFYGWDFVVQRNRISQILGDKFFPIYGEKDKLLNIIRSINPDVVHFEEFCESFVDEKILLEIFDQKRSYLIFETCHSSVTEPSSKIFKPDKFVMVSNWISEKFKSLEIPTEILEYPIENFIPDKSAARLKLDLDPNKKHVLNVGLFTQGKNQSEIFSYAEKMMDLPIVFHFVGNMASNFQSYWEPLIQNAPANCKIWGERHDVEIFYQASDLFLFTSTFELNPISIKEALSWKLKSLFRNLPTYQNQYDKNPLVSYLQEDLEKNLVLLKEKLEL